MLQQYDSAVTGGKVLILGGKKNKTKKTILDPERIFPERLTGGLLGVYTHLYILHVYVAYVYQYIYACVYYTMTEKVYFCANLSLERHILSMFL